MAEKTLGQVIAVERTLRRQDNDEGSKIKKSLTEARTLGGVEEYFPDNEDAPVSERTAPKIQVVQARVEDGLKLARKYSEPAMDIVATKDRTNTTAEADLIVDGTILVPRVPVSHLLWLEGYLTEWRGFLAMLPTLSSMRTWERDESDGLFKALVDERARTSKETIPLVLHPGTEKHPPQTTTIQKDVRTGRIVVRAHSGAIRETRKRELLDRTDKVIVAVKDAIARANRTPATEVKGEGSAILGYILGE